MELNNSTLTEPPGLMQDKLEQLLAQQQQMLELLKSQSRNMRVLYRRTTALALMLEAISKDERLKMPKVIRAEIDASLRPQEFEALAREDPEEFKKRYGEIAYKVITERGMDFIGRVDDITTLEDKQTIQ